MEIWREIEYNLVATDYYGQKDPVSSYLRVGGPHCLLVRAIHNRSNNARGREQTGCTPGSRRREECVLRDVQTCPHLGNRPSSAEPGERGSCRRQERGWKGRQVDRGVRFSEQARGADIHLPGGRLRRGAQGRRHGRSATLEPDAGSQAVPDYRLSDRFRRRIHRGGGEGRRSGWPRTPARNAR